MNAIAPIQPEDRIFILDVARGVALCGILILNIGYFGAPPQVYFNLDILKETSPLSVISWYLTNFLLEGSFRALFSMLFGASAILMISKLAMHSSGLTAATVYHKRLIWLLIFGLINAFIFLWPGDILYGYAICGLFLFPFYNCTPKQFIAAAVFFVFVVMFQTRMNQRDDFEAQEKGLAAKAVKAAKRDSLTENQKEDLQKWKLHEEETKLENLKRKVDKKISAMQSPSYLNVWSIQKRSSKKMETRIFYEELFFDILIFMLLGAGFYKMGLLTGEKSIGLYLLFIVVGYGLGFGWGLFTGNAWRQAHYNFFAYAKIQSPYWMLLYQPHRLLVSLGHIGLIIVLWKSNFFNWLLPLFACAGQMAFTNYLMQSLICSFLFHGYGLGYFGKLDRVELWYVVGCIWVFQIIFSVVWLRFCSMGPFEWVWKSLTYGRFQRLSRAIS